MIHIFYSTIERFYNARYFDEKLQIIPIEMQSRNKRYIRKEDRYLNLLGRLLLIEGLCKLGYSTDLLNNILYNQFGCPYFKENIYFSISHSGIYTVCAISDYAQIGIDVELCRQINFDDYKIAMNHFEWEIIKKSSDPYTLFFRFWTIKECFIKGLQKGMAIPINQLNINLNKMFVEYENEKWYIKHIPILSNYICTLASLEKISDSNISIHNCSNKY